MSSATLVPIDDVEVVDAVLVDDDEPAAWLPAVDPLTRPAGYPDDANPVRLYLAGLRSDHSRRAMAGALDRVAEHLSRGQLAGKGCAIAFPWHESRYRHLRALQVHLEERYEAPSTVNMHLVAVRRVLTECRLLRLLDSETLTECLAGLRTVRDDGRPPAGRNVTRREIRAVLDACDDGTALGARDLGFLAVLFNGGLRVSEVAALDLADYAPSTGELRVRKGKGRKQRHLYLDESARSMLAPWLAFRGDEPGALFLPLRRGGAIQRGQRTSAETLRDALARRVERAEVDKLRPHDARRTLVSTLLDRGVDLTTVAKLAGHSSVTTTARYDRRGDEQLVAASREAALPLVAWSGPLPS
jgi:integrase/recombinase XerD